MAKAPQRGRHAAADPTGSARDDGLRHLQEAIADLSNTALKGRQTANLLTLLQFEWLELANSGDTATKLPSCQQCSVFG